MTRSPHTRCWGVLVAFGLQLPAAPPPPAPPGQTVPTAVARPATPAVGPWTTAWSHPIEDTGDLLVTASGAFVFMAGPNTAIEARHVTTGDIAWRHTRTSWQTLSAADRLVLGVSDRHAYALDAATGQTRWVTETTGANTQLVTDGRHLLMVSDVDLLLRDLDSGTPLWRAGLAAPPSAPAAFGTDLIIVALQSGAILAFERATGTPRWQATVSSAARAVSTASPIVYAGLGSGAFCAFNDRNGTERWCFSLRVPVAGAPVVDGDEVRVALLDNSLRTFHRFNGSMGQPTSLGHRPAAGPWLTDTALIAGLTTGEFVVLDRRTGRSPTRLQVPDSASSHVLERAAISPDRQTIASLTVAPGAQRRLTAYRPRPAYSLPILPAPPTWPTPAVSLPPPPTRAAAPPAPRPFPAAR